MIKFKEFYHKYKTQILVTTGVVGGIVIGVVLQKKVLGKNLIDVTNKSFVTWVDSGARMPLEMTKEAIALNNNNDSRFAIIKYGVDQYQGIILDGSPVYPIDPGITT